METCVEPHIDVILGRKPVLVDHLNAKQSAPRGFQRKRRLVDPRAVVNILENFILPRGDGDLPEALKEQGDGWMYMNGVYTRIQRESRSTAA